MKIYLVDANASFPRMAVEGLKRTLQFLVSYHYYKNQDLDTAFGEPLPNLVADSGAFSAMNLGATIDLKEYAAWAKRWSHRFDFYANLDVIGDAKATLENQKRLEDMGLQPLPVFHVNEPWEYLEYYLEHYNYIALGGLVPHQVNVRGVMPWLIKAFKLLPDGKGYHGFGTTGWTVMNAFPWRSVDSSSWGSGYRYGRVPLFSAAEGHFVTAPLGDTANCFRLRHLMEAKGYDWRDFADRGRLSTRALRAKIIGLSVVSFLEAEDWLTRRHGLGKIYMSDPSHDVASIKRGFHEYSALRDFRRNGQCDSIAQGD